MAWDRKRPWTAPARSLVLYCPKGQWRFAVYNEAGVMDGHLPDLGGDASVDEAQAALLTMVEESSGLHYEATWKTDREGWWSADLAVAEEE